MFYFPLLFRQGLQIRGQLNRNLKYEKNTDEKLDGEVCARQRKLPMQRPWGRCLFQMFNSEKVKSELQHDGHEGVWRVVVSDMVRRLVVLKPQGTWTSSSTIPLTVLLQMHSWIKTNSLCSTFSWLRTDPHIVRLTLECMTLSTPFLRMFTHTHTLTHRRLAHHDVLSVLSPCVSKL